MDYIDLNIRIGPRTGENRYAVCVRSPLVGEQGGEFTPPVTDDQLELFVLHVGLARRAVRQIHSPEWRAARDFGQKLFSAVFTDRLLSTLITSRNDAIRQGKGLRLTLSLDAPELANYPWEFLYDRDAGQFLSLFEDTPVVRYVELLRPILPLAVTPPLRILAVASSPGNVAPLNIALERRNLTSALQRSIDAGLIEVDWLPAATLDALREQLLNGTYHIFHFIGHGGFDDAQQDGVLLFETEKGEAKTISGERIAVLLGNHRTLRLAVLNACEGARTSRQDPFAGAALTLMRTGNLPAVVAMQFEISDAAAIDFSRGFYSALAAGRPVDAAVSQGRQAIFSNDNDTEWGTPVLYLRAADARIFEIDVAAAARQAEQQARTAAEAAERAVAAKAEQVPVPREQAPQPEAAAPPSKTELGDLFQTLFGTEPAAPTTVVAPAAKPAKPPGQKKTAAAIKPGSKIVGIDFGTTNTVAAVMQGQAATVIAGADGSYLLPSVVAVTKDGERLVGQMAKRQALTNPENTIFSIKRLLGRKFDDPEVVRSRKILPYKIIRAQNGDAWIELAGRQYSPIEITAMILQKAKADAEACLGEKLSDAVITVPGYFDDLQRQATRDAGRIAGLEVKALVSSPVASALAYGLDKKQDQKIAVIHLGGGTFDISILELGDGVFQVTATNGDTFLGGDDFDERVLNWVVDECRKGPGFDLRSDRIALQRVKEAAEKAKLELSTKNKTEINLPFITADKSGPKHVTMELTRSTLESLVKDLVEKLVPPMRQALADAKLQPGDINQVVLVGGQTRMPLVRKTVQSFFGKSPDTDLEPEAAVALGAAIQAGVLAGEVKDVLLLDVTPLTLGVETLGGVATPIIERNTTIPTSKSQVFSTATDRQTEVEVHVLQGERPTAAENRSLGRFILDGIKPAPRGEPRIEVTFDIDASGILQVSARDQATGREQHISIAASSGLSKEEVERMAQEARLRESGAQ